MRKAKICVCGHFADGSEQYDGQTVKTREVYSQLVKFFGEKNVKHLDTHKWKKHPIKLLLSCIMIPKKVDDVIVMTSYNGVRFFIPLFVWLKKRSGFKFHYIVVGGGIYDFLKDRRKRLIDKLAEVDYVYVENKKLIKKLKSLGMNNLVYMLNFKDLKKSELKKNNNTSKDLRCCVFSRIEKEKGVLDVIDIVNGFNEKNNNKIAVDIYGKIKDSFENEFNTSLVGNEYIHYRGVVSPSKSVEVIEKYDLLLFPTRYKTEGIPGTIIDAYFAGVPVLASRWENFDEIIIEGKTGFGYRFGSIDDFYRKLATIIHDKDKLVEMGKNCLVIADNYMPENAVKVLIDNLGGMEK